MKNQTLYLLHMDEQWYTNYKITRKLHYLTDKKYKKKDLMLSVKILLIALKHESFSFKSLTSELFL